MDVPTWHPAGKRMSTLQSWGLYLALKPPSLGPHGYFVHTQPFCHLRIFISPSPQSSLPLSPPPAEHSKPEASS